MSLRANTSTALIALVFTCLLAALPALAAAKADLQIKAQGDVAYLGDNVYTAASQLRIQLVGDYVTAVYLLKIQNDGTAADTFKISASSPIYGWRARYVNAASGGNEITDAVLGGGWTTAALAAGASTEIRVEVTPQFAGSPSLSGIDPYRCTQQITATSTADSSASDTVTALTKLVHLQPDGQIKAAGDVAYLGKNVYSTTNGWYSDDPNEQIARQTAVTATPLVYHYRIQNDGMTDDTFTVIAQPDDAFQWLGAKSWILHVYDALVGGKDITFEISGAGWSTGTLAPGASRELRLELTPTPTSPRLCRLVLAATSETEPYQGDWVCALGERIKYQPDLQLRTPAESVYTGNNLYEPAAYNNMVQSKAWTTPVNTPAVYYLRIQNDGAQADVLKVNAPVEQYTGWFVRYFDAVAGGADITQQITGNGWLTSALTPGSAKEIRVEVTPNARVVNGSSNSLKIGAISTSAAYQHSTGDPLADFVELSTTKAPTLPDAQIKAAADASYLGANRYKDEHTHARLLSVAPGGTAVFHLKAQNNSSVADRLVFTGGGSYSAYTVRYFDALTGGNDITPQVKLGWVTGLLAPGASKVLRMEVAVSPAAGYGYWFQQPVRVTSKNELTIYDEVYPTVVTPAAPGYRYLPDAQIRTGSEGSFDGNNIYHSSGEGQSKCQVAASNTTATYIIRVQNDGKSADAITVTGDGPYSGWTVRYFDAVTGGNEITSQVTSGGWTTAALTTGSYKDLRLAVTPSASVRGDVVQPVRVKTTSTGDTGYADYAYTYTRKQAYRPDLQIRHGTDSYIGDNIYGTQIEQTKTQSAATDAKAVFLIKVQNDAPCADSLTLDGPGSTGSWTIKYYDAATGGADITTPVVNGTWATGTLAAGASRDIRAEVTPNNTATGEYTFLLYAYSTNDPAPADLVRGVAHPLAYQPDLHIGTSASSLIGNNIYEKDGQFAGGQTVVRTVPMNRTAIFYLAVQNDGTSTDTFTITDWDHETSGGTIRYYDAPTGGTNITTQVRNSGWDTGPLVPGAAKTFRLEVVLPYDADWDYITPAIRIIATSKQRKWVSDVVEANLRIMTFQPDLQIRTAADTAYIGDDLYETLTGQTRMLGVQPGAKAIFPVRMQNDGAFTDYMTLTAPATPAGWTVQYFDALTGGTNITAKVTGDGYLCDLASYWNRQNVFEGRIEVTPSAGIANGTALTVTLTGTSMGDPLKFDRVSAVAVTGALPDVKLRTLADAAYIGDNIYNTTGAEQTRSQSVSAGQAATFLFHAQNDSLMADTLKITGTAGGSGWTVKYADANSGADITSQVTGSGYVTGALAHNAYAWLRATVTPSGSVAANSGFTLTLTAASGYDAAKKDVVKAVTTVLPTYQPDMKVRTLAEPAYTGDNLYNTTGGNQTRTLTVAAGQAALYVLHAQNDGNTADVFTLKGTAGGNGWTVQYFNAATGAEITAQVTGTGYSTGALAPAAYAWLSVKVTPSSAVAAGASLALTVTATSTKEAAKQDVVGMTTLRQ